AAHHRARILADPDRAAIVRALCGEPRHLLVEGAGLAVRPVAVVTVALAVVAAPRDGQRTEEEQERGRVESSHARQHAARAGPRNSAATDPPRARSTLSTGVDDAIVGPGPRAPGPRAPPARPPRCSGSRSRCRHRRRR